MWFELPWYSKIAATLPHLNARREDGDPWQWWAAERGEGEVELRAQCIIVNDVCPQFKSIERILMKQYKRK